MRHGEIRSVDLDPARGSQASERRPAVIVSNDAANTVFSSFSILVPIAHTLVEMAAMTRPASQTTPKSVMVTRA